MAKKIAFTPASLDTMICARIFDPDTRGLALELLSSGKKRWRFRRRIARTGVTATVFGGLYPSTPIAAAREWAAPLNEQVELGIDPRVALREEKTRTRINVSHAHELYLAAVREGRGSRAKRINKPRTISDKIEIYRRDIAPALAHKSIYDVTEKDLIQLVIKKGKSAKVRANRLAAELKVFFGWCAGLRGQEVGLEVDPARRLGDLRFPEHPRDRKLSLEEISWFLQAVAAEPRDFRRGLLIGLLTATRKSEFVCARAEEIVQGIWTIPAERSKNRTAHAIALGPWGRSLMATNGEWVLPAEKVEGPRKTGWYKSRDRVLARMSELAGKPIERFNPHDFRRTARSNTKRLNVDHETAEAMLNHLKTGLDRIYDGYEMEAEMAVWFMKWENEIITIAKKAGVAEKLEIPSPTGDRRSAMQPGPHGPKPFDYGGGHRQNIIAASGRFTIDFTTQSKR